jgi:hypothetical protein
MSEPEWNIEVDPKQTYETWTELESMLRRKVRLIRMTDNITLHRMIAVQTSHLLLNNKQFYRDRVYQKILNRIVKKLSKVKNKPDYVAQLVPQLKSTQLSRRRWGIIRASSKLLDLHSRAVVTANHPSRIDFSIK